MSIRKKPDQAVPVLLALLDKVKQYTQRTRAPDTDDADGFDSLISKMDEIEAKLRGMEKSLPMIKRWEQSVTEQFCQLEQALAEVFQNPEMETNVHQKLVRVEHDIMHLQDLIKRVDITVNKNLSKLSSFNPENLPKGIEVSKKKSSTERVDLGIEFKISEIETTSGLFAISHRLQSSLVKMCLLCLSIFPENSEIKKMPLIYWWIGEGLVAEYKNKTAEENGQEVFQELLNEGFIKPSKENKSPSVNSFIVDPRIRRMLILAAEKNGFLTFSSQRTPSNGLRRAFLSPGNESYGTSNGERVEDLLTVFNIDEQNIRTRPEWLWRLNKVEVLQLGRWTGSAKYHIEVENSELLNGLGSQKHLKYLSLRGISRIEYLPRSIVKLISLKILDLRACHNLEKLPQGISALKNLTHLDVSECFLLESMPKGLEDLIFLQVLKGFVIGRSGKNSCKINDLNQLTSLRKLTIRIGDEIEAVQKDQLLSLQIFPDLRILTISWGVNVISSALETEWVPLPSSLRKLNIRCSPLKAVPRWMWPGQLQNLEKFYITGGSLSSLAHEDTQTWRVKYLRLKYLKNLFIDEKNLVSLFPEYLRLEMDQDVIRARNT